MTRNELMFTLGAWSLQEDTLNRNQIHIASIRHQCNTDTSHTIWFNTSGSITVCYCGAIVPDEIQGLCKLYNMDWIQRTDFNG